MAEAKVLRRPIVTEIVRLKAFFPAEDYHQDYVAKHPNEPYVRFNDLPKLTHLRAEFPDLFREARR